MSDHEDQPEVAEIMEEVVPSLQSSSPASAVTSSAKVVPKPASITAAVSKPASTTATTKPASTTKATALGPASKTDVQGNQILLNNQVNNNSSIRTNAAANGTNGSNSSASPPRRKCGLDKSGKEPISAVRSIRVMYDTLSGRESYPCNECDRPVCQESMWHWFSSVVVELVDAIKDMTSSPDTASKGCGSMDANTLRDNTKGTHAAFALDDEGQPIASSDIVELDAQLALEGSPFSGTGGIGGKGSQADKAPDASPAVAATEKEGNWILDKMYKETGATAKPQKREKMSSAPLPSASASKPTKGESTNAAPALSTVPSQNAGVEDLDAKIQISLVESTIDAPVPPDAEGSAAFVEPAAAPEEVSEVPDAEVSAAPEEPAAALEEVSEVPDAEGSAAPEEPAAAPEEVVEVPSATSAEKSKVQSMVALFEAKSKADEVQSKTNAISPTAVLEESEQTPSKEALLSKRSGTDPDEVK